MESDEETEQGSLGRVCKGSRRYTRGREAKELDVLLDLETEVKLLNLNVLRAGVEVHTSLQESRGSQNQGQATVEGK